MAVVAVHDGPTIFSPDKDEIDLRNAGSSDHNEILIQSLEVVQDSIGEICFCRRGIGMPLVRRLSIKYNPVSELARNALGGFFSSRKLG